MRRMIAGLNSNAWILWCRVVGVVSLLTLICYAAVSRADSNLPRDNSPAVIYGKHEFDEDLQVIEEAFRKSYQFPIENLNLSQAYVALFRTADCDGKSVKAIWIGFDKKIPGSFGSASFIVKNHKLIVSDNGDQMGAAKDHISNPYLLCGSD